MDILSSSVMCNEYENLKWNYSENQHDVFLMIRSQKHQVIVYYMITRSPNYITLFLTWLSFDLLDIRYNDPIFINVNMTSPKSDHVRFFHLEGVVVGVNILKQRKWHMFTLLLFSCIIWWFSQISLKIIYSNRWLGLLSFC